MSWLTIVGRANDALANLKNAAENGLKHGAIGYLHPKGNEGLAGAHTTNQTQGWPEMLTASGSGLVSRPGWMRQAEVAISRKAFA